MPPLDDRPPVPPPTPAATPGPGDEDRGLGLLARTERPERIERRAAALLLLLLALVVGAALYVMAARGAFEKTQRLVLVADDSEGVIVGMDLTFSGFPIGRVRRIELSPQGNARILIDVPRRDAHWLRESSVFTLTRGLVGNTALRAYSGVLTDPPLSDGAERRVLAGDAAAEVPKLVAAVRDLVSNLTALTAADAALAGTLANAQAITGKLGGPGGGLGVLMGNERDARQVTATLQQAQRTLARIDGLVARTDGLMARADAQVFGPQGLTQDAKASLQQLQGLLAEARESLKKVDAVLQDAQGTARNVRVATTDLDVLRGEVESSLRKVDGLILELHRKWPFKREAEVKLP